jgi:hypothetical protein
MIGKSLDAFKAFTSSTAPDANSIVGRSTQQD